MVDVTPQGLGIEVTEFVPAHSILNLTVAPAGYPIVLYRVSGEVRWTIEESGRYQLGVKILEVEDAAKWRDDFEERFTFA